MHGASQALWPLLKMAGDDAVTVLRNLKWQAVILIAVHEARSGIQQDYLIFLAVAMMGTGVLKHAIKDLMCWKRVLCLQQLRATMLWDDSDKRAATARCMLHRHACIGFAA